MSRSGRNQCQRTSRRGHVQHVLASNGQQVSTRCVQMCPDVSRCVDKAEDPEPEFTWRSGATLLPRLRGPRTWLTPTWTVRSDPGANLLLPAAPAAPGAHLHAPTGLVAAAHRAAQRPAACFGCATGCMMPVGAAVARACRGWVLSPRQSRRQRGRPATLLVGPGGTPRLIHYGARPAGRAADDLWVRLSRRRTSSSR